MGEFLDLWCLSLCRILAMGMLCWILSVIKKNVHWVDSIWSLFFVVAAFTAWCKAESPSVDSCGLCIAVLIWGVRLSAYLTVRNWGKEEDLRY
jgi:steroid 5-alpha reductase family enzyme